MNEIAERRGPGRPPKYHEAVPPVASERLTQSAVVQAAVKEKISEDRPPPRTRKPFGALDQKLAYPDRPGYHRHWFNDVPGRISRAAEGGYDHVKDKEGKNVVRLVGTAEGGGALHAYLMEIPEEWYQEDMRTQQREVDAKEATMKRGELESQEGDGRYVPAQGISIKHGGK